MPSLENEERNARPYVSVIMPIRNEGSFIQRSLGAVLEQDYPSDRYEVIVSDGMSTDNTRQLVEQMQEKYTGLRLIDNTGKIVPTGLNAALAQARGEIIIRVDGHTVIAHDYVRQCVDALAESGADNVGGRMDAVADGFVGQAAAAATSSPFGVGGARFHYSQREEWVDTVYLGAWRRELFERVGLFDEEQVRNQDDEFNYRLQSRGGRILLSPRIKSRYFNRCTLRSLWRQYLQYGYWKVRVMQKHLKQMRPRQFVPSAFVTALLVCLVWAIFSPLGVAALSAVAGSYLMFILTAAVLTANRVGWRYVLMIPLVLATIHVSYGVGFLLGLLRFSGRWGVPGIMPKVTAPTG